MIGTAADEGWDRVLIIEYSGTVAMPLEHTPRSDDDQGTSGRPGVILQVSRFPWGSEPAQWLRDIALAADSSALTGLP